MKLASLTVLLFVSVFLGLSAGGCGEEDLTSIKFTVGADGGGKMVSTVIRVTDAGEDPLRKNTTGVSWKKKQLSVVVQEATFDDVSKIGIAGIHPSVSGNIFRLTIPLGKSAAWTEVLAASGDDISLIKKLGEEQGLAIPGTVGTKFKFTVNLPGEIIARGFSPKIAKESSGSLLSFGSEEAKNQATLVIPLKKVRESTEKELVWEVTWKQ